MRWARLGVLALVVLAGCSVAGPSAPEPETLSPAPVPTTALPADAERSLPQGMATTGITDLDALVAAHVRAASESRWAWVETRTTSVTTGNVSVATSSTQSVTFEDRRTYRHSADVWTKQQAGSYRYREGYEQFANGSTRYESWLTSDPLRREFRRDDSPAVDERFTGFATGPIRRYLALESATVSRTGDGDPRQYAIVGSQSNVTEYGPVSEYRARAVVRADGFVTRLNVTYTVDLPDTLVDVEYAFTYRRIGTAFVERPAWIAAARNRTAS